MTKRILNQKFLSLIIIVLGFSLIFPGSLMAKRQKKGSTVKIETLDGKIVKGELLRVREDSMLIMTPSPDMGDNIKIDQIWKIHIKKKSRFFKSVRKGFLIGAGAGAMLGLLTSSDNNDGFNLFSPGEAALMGGIFLGVIGAAGGGILGAFKGIDKVILIKGRSKTEKSLILKKLDSYARFHFNSSSNSMRALLPSKQNSQIRIPEIRKNTAFLKGNEKKERGVKSKSSISEFSRFHISFGLGSFISLAAADIKSNFNSNEFSDDIPSYKSWLFGTHMPGVKYPKMTNQPGIFFKDFIFEYSLSNKFSMGLAYSPLGTLVISGRKVFPINSNRPTTYIHGKLKGDLIFLTVSYMNIPDGYLKKHSLKLGVGIGYQKTNIDFSLSKYDEVDVGQTFDKKSFSKRGICFLAAIGYDYYFMRGLSFWLKIDYKHIPNTIPAFQIRADTLIIDIPENKTNFGGIGLGINLGVHF